MKPKIISEKIAYQSSITKVIKSKLKLPNDQVVEWEYIVHPNGVEVLPVDNDGNVYLCREWRLAWKKELLTIPGGQCESDDENTRLKQVHNELREEIGMDAKKIEKLISYYNSGKINYTPHIYLATDLFPSSKSGDEGEVINIVKMSFKKAYEMFVSGKEPTTGLTLVAFLIAKEKLGN